MDSVQLIWFLKCIKAITLTHCFAKSKYIKTYSSDGFNSDSDGDF